MRWSWSCNFNSYHMRKKSAAGTRIWIHDHLWLAPSCLSITQESLQGPINLFASIIASTLGNLVDVTKTSTVVTNNITQSLYIQ